MYPLNEICENLSSYWNRSLQEQAMKKFASEAYSTAWHDSPTLATNHNKSANTWTRELWVHVENYRKRFI